MTGPVASARACRAKFWAGALCACICLALSLAARLHSQVALFDFDSSYNLQVSTSLADGFVYKNSYHPYKIYDSSITTNGPMQYVMALALRFFDLDHARALVVFGIYCAFLVAAFSLSPFSALTAAFLSLVWPALMTASAVFLGELMATAFCLAGIALCEAWAEKPKRSFPLGAAVCFGLAVSTKLITVVFVPVLLWYGLTAGRKKNRPWKPAAGAFAVALLVFVAGYYFSVAHSFLALWLEGRSADLREIRWLGLSEFVRGHVGQVRGAEPALFDRAHFTFLDSSLLAFAVCAAIVALYENAFFIFIIATPVVLLFAINLSERRLLPVICLIPLLGARSFWRIFWRSLPADRRRADLLLCGVFLLGAAALAGGKAKAAWGVEKRALTSRAPYGGLGFKRAWQLGWLPGVLQNYAGYPILTSGWWQLPEASLLTGINFFDRTASENEATFAASGKLYLLFRPSQGRYWPRTSRELCGEILFEGNDTVFCEFNRALPVNKETGPGL